MKYVINIPFFKVIWWFDGPPTWAILWCKESKNGGKFRTLIGLSIYAGRLNIHIGE